MRFLVAAILLIGQAATQPAAAAGVWHSCIAWGTSHTGRYTFRIAVEPCAVYWLELGRDLEISRCDPPWVVAIKPFAVSSGWELHFNLETGYFEDFTPTWSDRGRCARRGDESKR